MSSIDTRSELDMLVKNTETELVVRCDCGADMVGEVQFCEWCCEEDES